MPVVLNNVRDALAAIDGQPFLPKFVVDDIGTIAQHTVMVTNTGGKPADDVVLGFVKPPGAGQSGVPLQNLYE